MTVQINVVFDVAEDSPYYAPTLDAVRHGADAAEVDLDLRVVRTTMIDDQFLDRPGDGVVLGPGTPYHSPINAEQVIARARQDGVPLVGT